MRPAVRARAAGTIALLWLTTTSAHATGFDRIEAQCQTDDGATRAGRLLPDGTVSGLDGSFVSRMSPTETSALSRELDRIDFDRLPSDVAILRQTRNYCLLSRAMAGQSHVVWIDPVRAAGQRRVLLNVVTRILDHAYPSKRRAPCR